MRWTNQHSTFCLGEYGLSQVTSFKNNYLNHISKKCHPPPFLFISKFQPHALRYANLIIKKQSSPTIERDNLYCRWKMASPTTVMPLGEEELHLVAMLSRKNDKQYLCFWGFNVALVLYNSCLVMLNLSCLGMVFKLDETLVVVNTMRSFEDQIDVLQRKINTEVDPQRIAGMLAEVKRYKDYKIILKQYA
uniref:Uncharacterized protein n=1 Tax=Nelumbo nucifera TaxID=4432 RepID=A0A822YAR5_NELNU|nr:TPA_asm: hypothetical protein HUJ06_030671 [Nelumbo nucifera]